ncbi:transmembrane amino acid transporter protein-domain-containing protein [Xylaria sp. CBS 124048]|nr:transmembrane amino acid transporter protein-domain-containing protein [Xylaria sp. CBS 124048]
MVFDTKKDVQDVTLSTTPDSHMYNNEETVGQVRDLTDYEKARMEHGDARFHRLGWKRLTVVLIVEAIALGSLGMPSSFAALGMVAGTILTVGLGILAIYSSYVVGQVKIKYPNVQHYADAVGLMLGRFGYELAGAMFVLQLTFLVGSHTLTGTIAFQNLTDHGACGIVFGVVSAIILLLLALPPSFAELAILGYIDFVSIITAIGITIIATGIQKNGVPMASDWSAWPAEDITFVKAFIAVTNIVFAYSFAICQFSFMDEMHTPTDFPKSVWVLGIIEIIIYTLTGALIYAFVGKDVQSPALLSAGPLISKIAFGIALPVIFISGSINGTTACRYVHGRIYKNSVKRYINTPKGWISWIVIVAIDTVVGWVIAEAIPFFDDLLAISSALLISGFTFYFPAMMWFMLIREGSPFSKENLPLTALNTVCFIVGIVVLVGGTYSSVVDIIQSYKLGEVGGPFSCGV